MQLLGDQAASVLRTLVISCLLIVAVGAMVVGSIDLVGSTRRRSRRRRDGSRRADTTFYVGRLEAQRTVVYVVDRSGVRRLFEAAPLPWKHLRWEVARALAADALPVTPARRRLRWLARRVRRAPRGGFVVERRIVRRLAGHPARGPRRHGLHVPASVRLAHGRHRDVLATHMSERYIPTQRRDDGGSGDPC
jgi:hypothetical protein